MSVITDYLLMGLEHDDIDLINEEYYRQQDRYTDPGPIINAVSHEMSGGTKFPVPLAWGCANHFTPVKFAKVLAAALPRMRGWIIYDCETEMESWISMPISEFISKYKGE